jgi:hypothetical protein
MWTRRNALIDDSGSNADDSQCIGNGFVAATRNVTLELESHLPIPGASRSHRASCPEKNRNGSEMGIRSVLYEKERPQALMRRLCQAPL